jgi:hypothetical protein
MDALATLQTYEDPRVTNSTEEDMIDIVNERNLAAKSME